MITAFNVVLFDGFETLDAFGPVEILGIMEETYSLGFYSLDGGIVESVQHVRVETRPFSQMERAGNLLIPGGFGVRRLVQDDKYVKTIGELSRDAAYVLTVCTGSALLAKTGELDGKKATSNKMVFDWAGSNGPQVDWVRQARWVRDGKFYTASGVSAGMDMTLGFIRDIHGEETVGNLCREIEYIWNDDKDKDPFAT